MTQHFSELSQSFEPHQSSSPSPQTQFYEPSMVSIRNRPHTTDCFVFPPINHENLQISSRLDPEEIDPPSPSPSSSLSSSSSFSPSDVNWVEASPPATLAPPVFDSQVQKLGHADAWFAVGLDVLCSRVFGFVSSFRDNGAWRFLMWSLPRWAGVVTVVVWVYRWVRRRKRQGGSHNRSMKQIIEEKDERITQLLHQVSQMNELLLARHRALIGMR